MHLFLIMKNVKLLHLEKAILNGFTNTYFSSMGKSKKKTTTDSTQQSKDDSVTIIFN